MASRRCRPRWADPGVAKLKELLREVMHLPSNQYVYVDDKYDEYAGYVVLCLSGACAGTALNGRPSSAIAAGLFFEYGRMTDRLVLSAARDVVLAWARGVPELAGCRARVMAIHNLTQAMYVRHVYAHPDELVADVRPRIGPPREFRMTSAVWVAPLRSAKDTYEYVRSAFARKLVSHTSVFEEVDNGQQRLSVLGRRGPGETQGYPDA